VAARKAAAIDTYVVTVAGPWVDLTADSVVLPRVAGAPARQDNAPAVDSDAFATFMIDHDARSLELIARTFDGVPEGLTRDDVLDNVSLFWLTNSGVSAARLYWENKLPFFSPKNVSVPVGVSAFRDELYQLPRSWAERAYPKLAYYKKHDKGGHFAAWEQPALLTADLRATFKSLR
jgi:pimeloyl-ACP methyl ester carboxylesterase